MKISEMNLPQLKSYLTENGITVPAGANVAKLRNLATETLGDPEDENDEGAADNDNFAKAAADLGSVEDIKSPFRKDGSFIKLEAVLKEFAFEGRPYWGWARLDSNGNPTEFGLSAKGLIRDFAVATDDKEAIGGDDTETILREVTSRIEANGGLTTVCHAKNNNNRYSYRYK